MSEDYHADPQEIPLKALMILLSEAGHSWDYWGKFYLKGGTKVRDLDSAFKIIMAEWKCPQCDCIGCSCCSPEGGCHNIGWTQYPCTTESVP
jgi:hypothetical protein